MASMAISAHGVKSVCIAGWRNTMKVTASVAVKAVSWLAGWQYWLAA
jgi:hypothetical protein